MPFPLICNNKTNADKIWLYVPNLTTEVEENLLRLQVPGNGIIWKSPQNIVSRTLRTSGPTIYLHSFVKHSDKKENEDHTKLQIKTKIKHSEILMLRKIPRSKTCVI